MPPARRMNPTPCRKCVAEAVVEPTALGYAVKCSVCPGEHYAGPYKSRDKAVKEWNRKQERKDEGA